MAQEYKVALVVDPSFGERLEALGAKMHVWIVGTPDNLEVVRRMWDRLPEPYAYDIESGVTSFEEGSGTSPFEWCANVLDAVDQHHNEFSHTPPYSVLEVYGLPFSEPLRPILSQYGFTSFEPIAGGFIARKEDL